MITRVLIANRGEIACRIIQTCRKLGIATVAVYSDADASLPHVALADEAVRLGPAPANESYLNVDQLLAAVASSGADAVHPGYGFLSENTAFASACEQAGVIFVGPPAEAIRVMGDKAAARQLMAEHGVPVLPGFDQDGASDQELADAAKRVGFPLLIKAVAGGGGKGMRVVNQPEEFSQSLAAARREAMGAFGDDRVLLERYLARARHVEVQVFADNQGQTVHLFERDCSVQRRHQKIIEEAPAPGLSETLRNAMGEAAVRAARAIDYRGAGTVEFLLGDNEEFFFMEMNTRLQVEHPVTELITGQDLVAWQLQVAAGQPLPATQEQLRHTGHAMEVRIYAEDPARSFLPCSGTLTHLDWPRHLARVDSGYEQGDQVTSYYDPMMAKIICHGETREQARKKLVQALRDTRLHGLASNIGFLIRVLESDSFSSARLDTRLLEHEPALLEPDQGPAELEALAATMVLIRPGSATDPWQRNDGWRGLGRQRLHATLGHEDGLFHVALRQDQDRLAAEINGTVAELHFHWHRDQLSLTWGDQRWAGMAGAAGNTRVSTCRNGYCRLWDIEPDLGASSSAGSAQAFAAPMSGRIVALHVDPGATVAAGDPVITLEAMKMEHTLRASSPGVVEGFHVQALDQVSEGTVLVDFAPENEDA